MASRAPLLAFSGAAASVAAFMALSGVATASTGCDSFNCDCFPCGNAIELAVFDVDGNALDTGWTVEATVDGFAVENITECDPDFRFGNACSFGTTTGMYRITLRGPDVKTREIAAREAARSGDDCCSGACIDPTFVDAFLEPREDGE